MMRLIFSWLVISALGFSAAHAQAPDKAVHKGRMLEWTEVAPLPDALGFAGAFAGVSDGAVIVAGGANFPQAPPWEGGVKVWHDRIFLLPARGGAWRELPEHLPAPRGYGVSITTKDGILCIGGSDARQHYPDVWQLQWSGGKLTTRTLPPLPMPLANTCGAKLGNIIYVAGGIESPQDTKAAGHFLSFDLSKPDAAWQKMETWPGPPRMLAVAAVQDGSFFVISGVELIAGDDGKAKRNYLRDAYRYTPGQGWKRVADLPRSVAAAPSPAAAVGPAHVVIFGGDDGANVAFEPIDKHPGFGQDLLGYHTITDTWAVLGTTPAPQVTATLVEQDGGWLLPSGEIRPGVRTPRVLFTRLHHERADFGFGNYVAVAVYLLAMMSIGLHFARREQTTDQFFRGGQRIPWWAAGLSIYATMLSSITYMAVPGKAFATDWTFLLSMLGIVFIAPVVVCVYLPFFRQLDVTSAYEYLEKRFNLATRLFGSASFMLYQVGRVAIVLYLPALALSTVSSIDIYTCIVIMGALCVVYTVVGGIEAVIWTDAIQVIVLLAGVIIALALVLLRTDGGLGAAWEVAQTDRKLFHNLDWSWDTATATVWVILFGNFLSNLIGYTASQDVVQRYVTTRDQKSAARSIWTNAVMVIPGSVFFFALGTALYVFYKAHPQLLDPTLPTDSVFPQFIVREMPVGVGGLLVAGIFAAAQSTVSSSLNSIATCWVTDFYRRFKPGATQAQSMRMARGVTVAVGVVGVGVACVMAGAQIKSLWDVFLQLLGLTGGALAGLFALGIFTRRANGTGALIGAAAGIVVLYMAQHSPRVHFFLYAAIGIVTCFVVGYLASLPFGPAKNPLVGLTVFTKRQSHSGD